MTDWLSLHSESLMQFNNTIAKKIKSYGYQNVSVMNKASAPNTVELFLYGDSYHETCLPMDFYERKDFTGLDKALYNLERRIKARKTYLVFAYSDIKRAEFDEHYVYQITTVLKEGAALVVIKDSKVQRYLQEFLRTQPQLAVLEASDLKKAHSLSQFDIAWTRPDAPANCAVSAAVNQRYVVES